MLIFPEETLTPKSQAIHDRAKLRASRYLVAEAELLKSIMEINEDRTYLKFAHTHQTPYCVEHLGLSQDVAAVFVRVARKSRAVPQLAFAVEQGLALSKAKTIAAVITPANQSQWIARARELSKADLEKAVAFAAPAEKRSERARQVGENRHRVEFELDDENMQRLHRARDLASRKLGRAATLAETQEFLLKTTLHKEDPVEKAERAKWSRDRWVHHQVTKRDQDCCQAIGADGKKCGESRWVHQHHIQPKSEGGADTLENLVTLCAAHHRLWHEREKSQRGVSSVVTVRKWKSVDCQHSS